MNKTTKINTIMRIRFMVILALLLIKTAVIGQISANSVPDPEINDFAGIYSFLSSDWLEGREAHEKGGFIAADYIASMMQTFHLVPFGNITNPQIPDTKNQSYFQDFNLILYHVDNSNLSMLKSFPNGQSSVSFNEDIDYQLITGPRNQEVQAPALFAGYGLTSSDKGYDDYRNLDVKNKIVLVLSGIPGQSDTISPAWMKFNKMLADSEELEEVKIKNAREHGASGIIIIDNADKFEPFVEKQANLNLLNSDMNSKKYNEPVYKEKAYSLPGEAEDDVIPCFKMSSDAGKQLINEISISIEGFEKKAAQLNKSNITSQKELNLDFSIKIKKEAIIVRNVIGMIPGKDKTKNIVLGAHYDHLGARNGIIYNGADDNASGTSGLLALAKIWSQSGVTPEYNLIFASWTAEEEGLLGSEYFVQSIGNQSKDILLYINMDMISRSVAEDKASRQLSIGTRTSDEYLREISRKINSTLKQAFELDLWDVTGHSGSDYASFTAKNIPVMTFNTGLHDDYHTPRDISANADFNKMLNVLHLVNQIVQVYQVNKTGK